MIDLQTISFQSQQEWANWLAKNHATSNGIGLRLYKKDSGVAPVTHAEALDEALCYGWIDGQLEKYDRKSWLRKFTPRRPKSVWSLNRANTYAIAWRLQTAKKPETRARRMRAILEMLKRGEKFHG